MSYLKKPGMEPPAIPPQPPSPLSKTKTKPRAAAQKAKKLFAVDDYSVYDESP